MFDISVTHSLSLETIKRNSFVRFFERRSSNFKILFLFKALNSSKTALFIQTPPY